MERAVIKGKANHKNRKLHELSIIFCYACCRTPTVPFYCFDLMLCKILDIIFKKFIKREQKQTNTWYTLLNKLMQTTKKIIFHVCACIVRLQVLVCYVNTRLQRNINIFREKVRDWVLSLIRTMYRDTSKDVSQCKNLGLF